MKVIGVDASRYGMDHPTGVELYTNRVIEGLLACERDFSYRLYVAHAWQIEKLHDLLREDDEIRLITCSKFWTQVGLTRELKRDKVDMLFVPSHVLPRVRGLKMVMVVHGLEALHFPRAYSPFVRWYQRWSAAYAVKHASKLVAVSQAVKDDLISFFCCPSSKIEVIYEGYDVSDALEHGGEREPWILSVGRIEERKNQLRLVRAFEKFHALYPEWKMILVGPDGYGASKVHAYIASLDEKVRSSLRVLGHVDHDKVMRLMERVSVFAYPSLAEGFGLPLLEAMNAGTPILTSKGSACGEIASDAAYTVDPLDEESIFEGLKALSEDGDMRDGLIAAGEKRVQDFSWERCIDSLHALFEEF